MPTEFITTDQTTVYSVTSADNVFVLPGVVMTSTGDVISGTSASLSGLSLTIYGDLFGQRTIDLWGGSVTELISASIFVDETGSVNATEDAIVLESGSGNQVVNNGTITAQEAGVYSDGGDLQIENHGTIASFGESGQGAIIISGVSGGENIRGITNTGVISGDPSSPSTTYAVIQNYGGAEFNLNNSGDILAREEGQAIFSSATVTTITNSGTIVGDIVTTDETDVFNSGLIDGNVTLSAEDDRYEAIADGAITGILDLGDGVNNAVLGDVATHVVGGDDPDFVWGSTGGDLIISGLDDDLLRGRAGEDTIDGGSGDDTIRGGAGDDLLFGRNDDDLIRGGAGDDRINGGDGSDTMTGGAGADVFEFSNLSESPNNSGRDVIVDFTVGEDLIDLSAFFFATFATLDYIGDAAFSGTAAEVSVSDPNSIGRVKILVDVDGDGTADMKIVLNNTTMLSEDDFIL